MPRNETNAQDRFLYFADCTRYCDRLVDVQLKNPARTNSSNSDACSVHEAIKQTAVSTQT